MSDTTLGVDVAIMLTRGARIQRGHLVSTRLNVIPSGVQMSGSAHHLHSVGLRSLLRPWIPERERRVNTTRVRPPFVILSEASVSDGVG